MFFWILYGTRNEPNSEVKRGTVSTFLNHGTGIFMNALRDNIGEVFASPSWEEKAVSEYYANCKCWTPSLLTVFSFGARRYTLRLHIKRPIMCMPRQMWLMCIVPWSCVTWTGVKIYSMHSIYFCVFECLGFVGISINNLLQFEGPLYHEICNILKLLCIFFTRRAVVSWPQYTKGEYTDLLLYQWEILCFCLSDAAFHNSLMN